MHRLCARSARAFDRTLGVVKWLVLPISVLLFLQWPLREVVKGYAREANDLGQWLFALYVAVSVAAATRAGTHLAADALARRYSARVRTTLSRLCGLLVLVPWALFIAVSARTTILNSISYLEC